MKIFITQGRICKCQRYLIVHVQGSSSVQTSSKALHVWKKQFGRKCGKGANIVISSSKERFFWVLVHPVFINRKESCKRLKIGICTKSWWLLPVSGRRAPKWEGCKRLPAKKLEYVLKVGGCSLFLVEGLPSGLVIILANLKIGICTKSWWLLPVSSRRAPSGLEGCKRLPAKKLEYVLKVGGCSLFLVEGLPSGLLWAYERLGLHYNSSVKVFPRLRRFRSLKYGTEAIDLLFRKGEVHFDWYLRSNDRENPIVRAAFNMDGVGKSEGAPEKGDETVQCARAARLENFRINIQKIRTLKDEIVAIRKELSNRRKRRKVEQCHYVPKSGVVVDGEGNVEGADATPVEEAPPQGVQEADANQHVVHQAADEAVVDEIVGDEASIEEAPGHETAADEDGAHQAACEAIVEEIGADAATVEGAPVHETAADEDGAHQAACEAVVDEIGADAAPVEGAHVHETTADEDGAHQAACEAVVDEIGADAAHVELAVVHETTAVADEQPFAEEAVDEEYLGDEVPRRDPPAFVDIGGDDQDDEIIPHVEPMVLEPLTTDFGDIRARVYLDKLYQLITRKDIVSSYVCEIIGQLLSTKDCSSLGPREDVDNMVIMFAATMLMYYEKKSTGVIKRMIFNPMFASQFIYDNKRRIANRHVWQLVDYRAFFQPDLVILEDLVTADWVFIPVVTKDHWWCYALKVCTMQFFVIDSLEKGISGRAGIDRSMKYGMARTNMMGKACLIIVMYVNSCNPKYNCRNRKIATGRQRSKKGKRALKKRFLDRLRVGKVSAPYTSARRHGQGCENEIGCAERKISCPGPRGAATMLGAKGGVRVRMTHESSPSVLSIPLLRNIRGLGFVPWNTTGHCSHSATTPPPSVNLGVSSDTMPQRKHRRPQRRHPSSISPSIQPRVGATAITKSPPATIADHDVQSLPAPLDARPVAATTSSKPTTVLPTPSVLSSPATTGATRIAAGHIASPFLFEAQAPIDLRFRLKMNISVEYYGESESSYCSRASKWRNRKGFSSFTGQSVLMGRWLEVNRQGDLVSISDLGVGSVEDLMQRDVSSFRFSAGNIQARVWGWELISLGALHVEGDLGYINYTLLLSISRLLARHSLSRLVKKDRVAGKLGAKGDKNGENGKGKSKSEYGMMVVMLGKDGDD
ncbi:hypothetical protein V8G54_025136 [Vigna mungo]|uniref:Ubiquitin-like protease family profile domain-containing protein n=1 Tax=Vigna mungo TaxID=3915 RepID=A0AAQ3N8H3_VIGMU